MNFVFSSHEKKVQEQEILHDQEDERLKRLKFEQESKLDETKKSSMYDLFSFLFFLFLFTYIHYRKNQDITSNINPLAPGFFYNENRNFL